jgi:hypothetical protein
VRLLGLYMCNYKLKSRMEFKQLCMLFDADKYPQGLKFLETMVKLTQCGDDLGDEFSESI